MVTIKTINLDCTTLNQNISYFKLNFAFWPCFGLFRLTLYIETLFVNIDMHLYCSGAFKDLNKQTKKQQKQKTSLSPIKFF